MRGLPDPGFAGDEGAADELLGAALKAYDEQPDSRSRWLDALATLQDTRVLVPVVATATGEDPGDDTGRLEEGGTDMAAVLMQSRSGRTALLAFTGLARCRSGTPRRGRSRWPSPTPPAPRCRTGPRRSSWTWPGRCCSPSRGDDLRSLASGDRLARVGAAGWGWVRPG